MPLKDYLLPPSICLVTAVFAASIDLITPQKEGFFNLSYGFGRRVEIVETSEFESADPTDWNCPSDSSTPFYIYKQNEHKLILQEDFHSPIQISVEAIQENSENQTDPAIIIKSLNGEILACEDAVHDNVETLTENEIKEIWINYIPQGTYLISIGSYYNHANEHKIIIKERD